MNVLQKQYTRQSTLLKKPNKNPSDIVIEKRLEFFIKSDGKNYPVLLDDILYCEAKKNYTMVVLKNDQKLMPLIPLSKFETLLSDAGGNFIQIHRSFLIARKHITAVSSTNATIKNKFEIPIGIQFKEKFFKAIGMKDST